MALMFRLMLVVMSMVFLMLAPARAQNSSPGNQPTPPSNQPSISVANFLANPNILLTQYPQGGGSMVPDVSSLVESDIQTVNPLVGLVPNANADQKNALGTGLGLAALGLVGSKSSGGDTDSERDRCTQRSHGACGLRCGNWEPAPCRCRPRRRVSGWRRIRNRGGGPERRHRKSVCSFPRFWNPEHC